MVLRRALPVAVPAATFVAIGAAVGAAAAVGGAGCGQPEQPACDIDSHAIGKWLADQRFGTDPRARRQWETDYSQMIFWLDYSADNWCVDMPPGADTACWSAAGETRPECMEARARLEHVAVTGPLCGYWLEWFTGDAFAREGFRYDVGAFRKLPFEAICISHGGLPLGCLSNPDADARCSRLFQSVRQYLPDGQ